MKLYYHPLSTYSWKALFALHLRDAAFEKEVVALFDPPLLDAYEEGVNPWRKVPFLVVGDRHFGESSLVVEVLDELLGEPRLVPETLGGSREVRRWDRLADQYLLDPLSRLFREGQRPREARRRSLIASLRGWIERAMGQAERQLGEREWLVGDALSLADVSWAAGVHFLPSIRTPVEQWPRMAAWFERVSKLEPWRRIQEEAAPAVAAITQKGG